MPGGPGMMPVQPASQKEITDSPLWHLFDYDLASQTFAMMRIEENLYRKTSFLDQRILSQGCPTVRYELRHMARTFPRSGQPRGPMRFIFHVGHCGSTLLSRALGVPQSVLPFREPLTLRTLSADQRLLDTPLSFLGRSDWDWLLTTIIDSLARRFRPDQTNIVKATSTGNNLIGPVMEENESHRAILLYVPLEVYMASMVGKPREGGDLWGQASTRMQDWMKVEESPPFGLSEMKAPHFAALSWMTSMNYMLDAKSRFGDRLRLMNFEDLMAEPEAKLAESAKFFDIESATDTIVDGFPEIASSYSKQPDRPFTPEMRKELLDQTRRQFSNDIATGMEWARKLIERVPQVEDCGDYLD